MAKKHPRKKKNSGIPASSAQSDPLDKSSAETRLSFPVMASFGLAAITLLYWRFYLLSESDGVSRLKMIFALVGSPDIYWAYWTGSPNGSIGVLDRWPILLGVLFHFGLAIGIGKLVLSALPRYRFQYNLEKWVVASGIGLMVISSGILVLGVMQLYHLKWLCVFPFVIAAIAGWVRWFQIGRTSVTDDEPQIPKQKQSEQKQSEHKQSEQDKGRLSNQTNQSESNAQINSWSENWAWLILIPFALFLFLGSMIPPWEYDVREYHLQVPKEWYQAGGVQFLEHNVYGNMPLGTEMHALFGMLYSFGEKDWWWGALIGKTVSGCFTLLSAATLICLGARFRSTFCGLIAAVIYLSTPWTIANGIIGYNEGALSFYLLLSLLILVIQFGSASDQSRSESMPPFTGPLLFGFFLGGACAVKYTGVVFVALPGILTWMVLSRNHSDSKWKTATWLALGIALMLGPWLAKNILFTGNPTYPLAATVFPTPRTEAQIQQWANAHSVSENKLHPQFFLNDLHNLGVKYKWLSPLAVPFFLAACYVAIRDRRLIWIAIYLMATFVMWWVLTHRLERFWLPFYPVMALLAGIGFCALPDKPWRITTTVFLLIGVVISGLIGTSRRVGDVRLLASLKELNIGTSQASDYRHPQNLITPLQSLSPAVAWLNEQHPDSKVLFLGECRTFYAQFDAIYNTCFDDCQTWQRFADKDKRQLHQELLSEGITHVLIHWSELRRLETTYGYNINHAVDLAEGRYDGFDYRSIPDRYPQVLRRIDSAEILQDFRSANGDQGGEFESPSWMLFSVRPADENRR